MSDAFSIRRRLESFRYASRGIVAMLRTQHNSWIHAAATISVVALGVWLGLSTFEWCWIVLAMMAVWTAEAVNTALEHLGDAVTSNPNPLIGRAKDAAAGAVLISAVGAALIGFLVLGPHLWERI